MVVDETDACFFGGRVVIGADVVALYVVVTGGFTVVVVVDVVVVDVDIPLISSNGSLSLNPKQKIKN